MNNDSVKYCQCLRCGAISESIERDLKDAICIVEKDNGRICNGRFVEIGKKAFKQIQKAILIDLMR